MTSLLIFLTVVILSVFVLSMLAFKTNVYLIVVAGIISFLSTIFYIITGAVDVAFTEAAIGAVVSTTLLLMTTHLTKTMNITGAYIPVKETSSYKRILMATFVLLVITSLIFFDAIISMPVFGEYTNPSNNIVYLTYLSESYTTFKVQNPVTMILGSFRGYDTLGEAVVILVATLGVLIILRKTALNDPIFDISFTRKHKIKYKLGDEESKHLISDEFIYNSNKKHRYHRTKNSGLSTVEISKLEKNQDFESSVTSYNEIAKTHPSAKSNNKTSSKFKHVHNEESNEDIVSAATIFILFPFIMLFAFYVQFHGDFGPGGGFQAGAIFAACYIMMILLFGYNIANRYFRHKMLFILLALGAFIYAGTGFITMFLGGGFLDYYVLGRDFAHSYHYGLLSIELGVGLTVFASMSLIIGRFYVKIRNYRQL